MIRILSLGAGVQSSTVLRMSIHGELPKLDGAIFADTQWEPPDVYRHLETLKAEATAAGIPVYMVTRGNLREHLLTHKNGSWSRPAFFVRNPDGSCGMTHRQCTGDFKISPIVKTLRVLVGIKPRGRPKDILVEQWIGISRDEAHRAKPPKHRWIVNRWPLLDLRMTRWDCLEWNRTHGYPRPPKSACIGCPFHSDAQWMKIKADPALWADACEFDDAIREHSPLRLKGEFYLHGSLVPLRRAILRGDKRQPSLFGNECEGMCGV